VTSVRLVSRLGASALLQSSTASLAHPAPLVKLDRMDSPATPDLEASPVLPVLPPILAPSQIAAASSARLVLLAPLVKMDKQVPPAPTASLDKTDSRDKLVPLDPPDPPEMPASLEDPETTDNQEALARTASVCTTPPAPRDPLVPADPPARTANQEAPEELDNPDTREDPARPETPDAQEAMDSPVLPAVLDSPARTHTTARARTVRLCSSRKQPSTEKDGLEMINRWEELKMDKTKFHSVDAAVLVLMLGTWGLLNAKA